jgi:hypothetical protein
VNSRIQRHIHPGNLLRTLIPPLQMRSINKIVPKDATLATRYSSGKTRSSAHERSLFPLLSSAVKPSASHANMHNGSFDNGVHSKSSYRGRSSRLK